MLNQSDKGFANSLPIIALSLLLGVCLLHIQPDLRRSIWTAAELLMFLPVCLWLFYCLPQRRAVIAFLVGYLWALLFAHVYLNQQLRHEFVGEDILLEGVVRGVVDKSAQSIRFNFEVTEYITDQNTSKVSGSSKVGSTNIPEASFLRLSWFYHKQLLHTGEHWRLRVRLKPPHGMQNPGGFDYEKWLYLQGIHATGYVRKSKDNQLITPAGLSMDGLRESLLLLISELPDKRYQGLLQALTVGHKSLISAEQWQVLRNTGTSHLMAISGLHIGLIAALVFFLARWLVPARLLNIFSATQIAAVFSLFAALFYALLAGFTVPTQRAFIMLLVIMLGILLKHPAFSINSLSLALIAVILINPVSVLSAGFWLSFLAVFIIMLVSSARPRYSRILKSGMAYTGLSSRLESWMLGVKTQWLIALGMLPLSVLLFQQGSIISPVANMLVIPLVGMLVVPVALMASIISMISTGAAIWLFSLASDLLALIWSILQWLGHSPLLSWQSSAVPLLYGLLALLGVALLLMPRGFPLRFAGFLLLMPMLFYKAERPLRGDFWVTVLDVGQGLSVLVQTREKALLYDAGAKFSDRFDIGEKVVLPYLQYAGVQQLDTLLVSHTDNDHAGGAEAVLAQMKVQRLLAGKDVIQASEQQNQQVSVCRSGQSWYWDDVYFEILHPDRDYSKSNNRSCVLKVSTDTYSLLLTGDIEAKIERHLLRKYLKKLQVDVLLVPHHGSNTSSSKKMLEIIKPQLAIISAGYKNRFGHPTFKVIDRYRQVGSRVLNTAYQGAIQIKFSKSADNGRFQVNRQRKLEIHYWNHRF